MKTLPKLIFIAFILSFPSLVVSQSKPETGSELLTGTDFHVKNVRLGTAYEDVIKNLGKPLKSKKIKKDYCGEDTHLILHYPGLTIDLTPAVESRDFSVLEIEITSSKWTIGPGISIGGAMPGVRTRLGTPWNQGEEEGFATMHYLTKDNDMADLYFQKGNLVKVKLWINPC